EEAKEQQEEGEAPVAPDYAAIAEYGGILPAEQWPSDFVNVTPDVGATGLVAPGGAEWASPQAPAEWDGAAAPNADNDLPPAGVVPPTGWDPVSVPSTGWD
ncbi:hypothetical protein T12_14197, partial [Trichinella patagoniensis]